MKKLEILILTTVFNGLLFGCFLAGADDDFFRRVYVVEDGPIETLSALALLGCSALCVLRAFRLRSVKPRLFLASTLFLGLVFLFGAGEEISWGQRIFKVESPEFFSQHNEQGETNLHNLVVGGVKINKLVFGKILAVGIIIYMLVIPPLSRRWKAFGEWVDAFGIPIPRSIYIVFYLGVFAIVSLTPSGRKGELLEFGGCFLFLLIGLYPRNAAIFAADRRAD